MNSNIFDSVSASVSLIEVAFGTWYGLGTGTVIDTDGYIVTNNHVVEKGYTANIKLKGLDWLKADIVFRDTERDLAIIKCPPGNYPALKLGSTDRPQIGEEVIAFGFPTGEMSITKGIISAFRNMSNIQYFQIDAAINPGNSGGPLVNLRGEFVGINTSKYANAEGIGFSIAVGNLKNYLNNVIQKIKSGVIIPIPPPPQIAKMPDKSEIVFRHQGKGRETTPIFDLASYSIPWKLLFQAEFDGRVFIEASFCSEGSTTQKTSRIVFQADVSQGRLYETYVYINVKIYPQGSLKVQMAPGSPTDKAWSIWVTDERVNTLDLPFTYTSEGTVRTPPFLLKNSVNYRMTFLATWEGNCDFTIYDIVNNNHLFGRSTGSWKDFPKSIQANNPFSFAFTWRESTQIVFLGIGGAPPLSNWAVSIAVEGKN